MIEVAPNIKIEDSEIQYDFIRASGPGGQNVNKVASSVQLRFDVRNSPSLPEAVKQRLEKLAGSRLTTEGVLIIDARQYRTQEQNRQDALARLQVLVCKAAEVPRLRRKTSPTITARAARLEGKKRRGQLKRTRSHRPQDWEE